MRDQQESREGMPPANSTVAVVVLLRHDGAALLQHRDDKPGLPAAGMWVPPGGHCEPGESLEACARREFLEETGYECGKLPRLTSFLDDHVEGVPPCYVTAFWAHYDGVQSLVCREGQDLRFVERHRVSSHPIADYLIHLWDLAMAAASLTAPGG